MKKIKLLITLTCLFFTSPRILQADTSYALSNYAEITTAVLRGPLAAVSYHNHGKYTKTTKLLHAATDMVRLANEILTIINHPNNINPSSYFWIIFDLANVHVDLFEKDEQSSDLDLMSLSTEHTDFINLLAKVSQTCLLPFTESATAFYRAANIDQTPEDSLLRRQEQAFCSLSRAISIFLNHQHSKLALILLFAALTETILALSNYPSINVAPEPAIIPGEQNQVNNNNVDLGNNQQQQDNLPDQEEEELVFYDVIDHFEDEELAPDNNNPEQELINNQDDDSEEELIFYDAVDHFEDELPPDGDNLKQK